MVVAIVAVGAEDLPTAFSAAIAAEPKPAIDVLL